MSNEFHAGATTRMHALEDGGFGVLLACPPVEPCLKAVTAPGALTAMIAHDPGTTWPDRAGRNLVRDVIRRGGVAVLWFTCVKDASGCMTRLRKEGVR